MTIIIRFSTGSRVVAVDACKMIALDDLAPPPGEGVLQVRADKPVVVFSLCCNEVGVGAVELAKLMVMLVLPFTGHKTRIDHCYGSIEVVNGVVTLRREKQYAYASDTWCQQREHDMMARYASEIGLKPNDTNIRTLAVMIASALLHDSSVRCVDSLTTDRVIELLERAKQRLSSLPQLGV